MDMQNNQEAIKEAMRLAQTPEGQQLIRLLQASQGTDLQDAMRNAAAGDYASAKKALGSVLNHPEAQALLRKLGGNHGPDGR